MQAIIQKVALQAALIGSMSVGSYVIRKISKPKFHEYIQNTVYLRLNQDLSSVLNDISFLKNDELFKVIIDEVELFLETSTNNHGVAQWKINRFIKNIMNLADLMKKKAVLSQDDDAVTVAVDYERDHRDVLNFQLESVLHNLLLNY